MATSILLSIYTQRLIEMLPMQILIDTNVLLDFLLEREPFQQGTSAPDLSSVAAPPNFGIDEADYIVIEKLKSTIAIRNEL